MPSKSEIVPLTAELVQPGGADSSEVQQAAGRMVELLQSAIKNMQLQNVREVETSVRTAEAICGSLERRTNPEDRLALKTVKYAVWLFAPLTRVIVFQTEGRFARARNELAQALPIVNEAISTIDQYGRLANCDQSLIQGVQPLFLVVPILFRGLDLSIQADIVGYQGDVPQYVKLLRASVEAFRAVKDIPPSDSPTYLMMASLCTTHADRLETRADVFEREKPLESRVPVVKVTGDKIFIIHGHDEAKWRELKDLLERRMGLKTVVLKEEPGAGETLIQKFEEFAANCQYAFALVTPDDFVDKQGKTYFQARPNVLFEIGWFYGHFGHERVCIVKKAETAMPSDLAGILTVDFHEKVTEAFVEIQDELKRVGVIPQV